MTLRYLSYCQLPKAENEEKYMYLKNGGIMVLRIDCMESIGNKYLL